MRRALLVVAAAVALAGCGNVIPESDLGPSLGTTGLTVDGSGGAAVVVAVCDIPAEQIAIVRDREGLREDQENEVVGTWTLTQPTSGLLELDLAAPGPEWEPHVALMLEPDRGYLVNVQSLPANAEGRQAYAHGRDLATITPAEVIVTGLGPDGKNEVVPRATFLADFC